MSAPIVMPRVLVRAAKPEEIDDLEELDKATLPECPPSLETDWWGAWCGGELVGYAGGQLTADGTAYYLSRSGVLPAFRGRGIQKRLIRVRLKYAATLGLEWAVTYTATYNPASANALIACGFRAFLPAYQWAGPGWNYWRKALQSPERLRRITVVVSPGAPV
jgi:GNAT superfamily N-acetyltransferase